MPVKNLESESQYKEAISQSSKPTIVEFVAPWESTCKEISPRFRRCSDQFDDAEFYSVDICDQQEIGMSSGVTAAPMYHFYKDGEKKDQWSGHNGFALERWIASHAKS